MKQIIRVEGYKAFHGIMKINYANPELAKANGMVSEILGDWLYKPDTDCWYSGGRSFPADRCSILEVM